MSKYYNPKRAERRFIGSVEVPYRISRSNLELFIECPRCFYFDRKLGVARPPGYPFSLNSAVDTLLKKEFDFHRTKGSPHPLMESYGIDAVPFKHEKMNHWRDALRGGITYHHEPTNFMITGGVDDVWVNPKGQLLVVDYKATSKRSEVSIDADWQGGYKRQVEMYQWLFRQNGFNVSDTAYFVYANGDADKEVFDQKLEFKVSVLPYEGDDSWVEEAIMAAHRCLSAPSIPPTGSDCDYCKYREAIRDALAEAGDK